MFQINLKKLKFMKLYKWWRNTWKTLTHKSEVGKSMSQYETKIDILMPRSRVGWGGAFV